MEALLLGLIGGFAGTAISKYWSKRKSKKNIAKKERQIPVQSLFLEENTQAAGDKRIAVGSFPYPEYDFSWTEEENLPLIADWCVSYANSTDETDTMWGSMPIVCNGNLTRAPQVDHTLVGTELNVVAQYNDGYRPKVGENLVFFNRLMNAPTTLMGIGPNRFNVNTTALFISSQAPSEEGEFCGWEKGIRFDRNSLSPSVVDSEPTAIDMRENTVMGAGGNPWFVLFRKGRYTYGIRFNTDTMCIEFVKDVYGSKTVMHSFDMNDGDLKVHGDIRAFKDD